MATKVLSTKQGMPKADLESPLLQESIPVVATSYRPSKEEIASIDPASISADEIELAISWSITTNGNEADPTDTAERDVIRDLYRQDASLMVEDVLHYRHSLAASAPSDLPLATEITPSQSSGDPLPSSLATTTTISEVDVAFEQKAKFKLAVGLGSALAKRETLTSIEIGKLLQEGFDLQKPFIKRGEMKKQRQDYLAEFKRIYQISMGMDPRSNDYILAYQVYRLVDNGAQECIMPSEPLARAFRLDTLLAIGEWVACDDATDTYSVREGFENAVCEICKTAGEGGRPLTASETRDAMSKMERDIELARIASLKGADRQLAEKALKAKTVVERSKKIDRLMETVRSSLGKLMPLMGSSELLVELERAGILTLDAKPIDPKTVSAAKACELAEAMISHDNAAAIAVMLAKFDGYRDAANHTAKHSPAARESLSDMPTIAKPDVFTKPAPSRHHELFSLLGQSAALQPAQSN